MQASDKGERTANNSNHLTALNEWTNEHKFALSRKSRGTPAESAASEGWASQIIKGYSRLSLNLTEAR